MTGHKIIVLTSVCLCCGQLASFAQTERYLPMGVDQFNQKPVYLDQESITKIGSSSYRYTLSSESEEPDTGKPGRFEEDLVVDCTQLASIVHLGSRLYDGKGRLIKSDSISRTQEISTSRFAPYVNGNQIICNQLPKS
jgi:hypothetical protein